MSNTHFPYRIKATAYRLQQNTHRFFLRTIWLLTVILMGSCQSSKYSAFCPKISIADTTNPRKVLIANSSAIKTEPSYLESCLEGVNQTISQLKTVKVTDEVIFDKRPEETTLKALEEEYHTDGILYLADVKMKKEFKEVKGKAIYHLPVSPDKDEKTSAFPQMTWTNMYVLLKCKWEYYDFATRMTYQFDIENDKIYEFNRFLAESDSLEENQERVVTNLFFQNGKKTALSLLGEK